MAAKIIILASAVLLVSCGGDVPDIGTTVQGYQDPCPDCFELSPQVTVDTTAGTLDLSIDAFPNFDYSGVSLVELELKESAGIEIVDLSFGPEDIEYGASDEGLTLPSGMTGMGLQAAVAFFEPDGPRVVVSASVTVDP